MNDYEITKQFMAMLKRHGVKTEYEEIPDGQYLEREFTIKPTIDNGTAITFCFHNDYSYDRIMGYTERGYSDEIHKDGWK